MTTTRYVIEGLVWVLGLGCMGYLARRFYRLVWGDRDE